jgi:hypothetical protein
MNSRLTAVRHAWLAAWPTALEAWSRFTRLRPPQLCLTSREASTEGLSGSFAMIRLVDQAIIVDLEQVMENGVDAYPVEILAHEIGHHVLAPATLIDHGRSLARIRHALPTVEQHAPMVANLYTDLLINDRLQRSAGLKLSSVFQALAQRDGKPGPLWTLYIRMYENLWSLERGSLGGGQSNDKIDGDAWLGSRLVRSYAGQWIEGSGKFAALLLTYLLEDKKSAKLVQPLLDAMSAGEGSEPMGLTEEDPNERTGNDHPALDSTLAGEEGEVSEAAPADEGENRPARGQARQPFEYGELLKAAGLKLSAHEAAVRYYRERARPHLVRFPTRRVPESEEPLLEGLEPWELGDPMDELDWMQSLLISPRVIPGLTTVRRVWGTTEGVEARRIPVDLDIYIDSSGSMANPQQLVSFPALAGAVLCLSALRAGARVQATLWSGTHQVMTTKGFVRDETAVLRVLTGYLGGGTAFPIHILRDTYSSRPAEARPAHILVVSDDGVTTMFQDDERGNSGWDVAATSLARAGGGGTLVLNIPQNWWSLRSLGDLRRAQKEGWNVHRVATWDDLLAFAREFSRRAYGEERAARTR